MHKENEYAKEAMQWYGWGSPVGLSLGLSLVMVSLGAMLWMMHLAGVV